MYKIFVITKINAINYNYSLADYIQTLYDIV